MKQEYFTVSEEIENTIVIERSKFICSIKNVSDEIEARAYVDSIKKRHTLATHYCYAYIADENGHVQKFSDAGEPQGTAGLPMLEVLKNKKMHKTVAVVTRYFGGVKLGTGGLARAYSTSVLECLKLANVQHISTAVFMKIKLDYDKYNKLTKIFSQQGVSVISTRFDNDVLINIAVKSEKEKELLESIIDISNGHIEHKMISVGYHAFKD